MLDNLMYLEHQFLLMINIGIILTDPEDWTTQALLSACRKRGLTPQSICLKDAEVNIGKGLTCSVGAIDLYDLDAVVVRDVGAGTFEGMSFRFDVLRQLEKKDVVLVNSPESIQNAANKYYSSYLLARRGLPVPRTFAVQSRERAMDVLAEVPDAVIKPIFGYKGRGIIRVKEGNVIEPEGSVSGVLVEKMVDEILVHRGMLYIQEFVENPGRDVRAFVVGDRVAGAIYRNAPDGYWLNNLSQGGKASACVLSPEQKEMCLKASEVIGTVFSGVDLIESPSGSLVLEVNGTPSGAGIYSVWGINSAEMIIDHILAEIG